MDKKRYKHLVIKISPKNIKTSTIKKWIGSNSSIQKIVRKIVSYSAISNSEKRTLQSIELLNQESEEKAHDFDSPYGYEDDLHELKTALKYAKQIQEGFKGPSESKQLYSHIETILTDLFLDEKTKTFFNFGVSYANIDSILASKFSEIQFIGIDRSIFTKAYNESLFAHLHNLQFVAGAIFEFLDKNQFPEGIFFHTRTLVLLPKVFIEKLYKAIAKAKFQYIICVEQIGISRQTLQAYQFSEEEQSSVAYRDMMYIHNYPALLKGAGFSVERSELVKTNHPHEDLRLLSISAQRNQ